MTTLLVSEIFLSIQGESSHAGRLCVFIRLAGCPLRCDYCDTTHARDGGEEMTIADILGRTATFGCPLVEVTGGEPLAQKGCAALLAALLNAGCEVMLETSGAFSITSVPRQVRKIMDFKCPSSGEMNRNLLENAELLTSHDEVKFVIGARGDYEWARDLARRFGLATRCRAVLFSPVFGKLEPATLAEWMMEDRIHDARMQIQTHKYIWHPERKKV
ncbi:MAG: radical SAM protein [Candidatus Sumerlaeota bacterium]|nr:radical SAM protein [Candidatus Sumerlaeota bacterium]